MSRDEASRCSFSEVNPTRIDFASSATPKYVFFFFFFPKEADVPPVLEQRRGGGGGGGGGVEGGGGAANGSKRQKCRTDRSLIAFPGAPVCLW